MIINYTNHFVNNSVDDTVLVNDDDIDSFNMNGWTPTHRDS